MPCNCNLLFQTKLKDNTEMIQNMKQHVPELEKLNKEVIKLRKLKKKKIRNKHQPRRNTQKVYRTSTKKTKRK